MIMIINDSTKIGSLLKHHPDVLETIVSLSPKFIKLRNPLLRKVIAGRTSIAMASKMGGCSVDDFFNKLKPLGFEVDTTPPANMGQKETGPIPAFLENLPPGQIIDLDVRPVIEGGKDPLNVILQKVKGLDAGYALKIINSFEPTPLMHLLGKQGFISCSVFISSELVYTYFFKTTDKPLVIATEQISTEGGWDEIADRFKGRLEMIDVRELEMPLPMHSILDALDKLPADKALFVYHKRIPVFLLPELAERKCSYRIKEVSDAEVQLLIYKD
jgi:uncharacterized protein (DUF2249 family)